MSRARPPLPERHVRFADPPSPRSPPQSILRPSARARSPKRTPPGSPPAAMRRSSLPDMRRSATILNERRLHALEALHDMRSYLKEACNLQGEDSKRTISVLSIDALSALIAFVNALREEVDTKATRRDETLLRSMVDATVRHPHELLMAPEREDMNVHERNARRGHLKRMRREAEYRLARFASKQLKISLALLRDLPHAQREQRELDAFKSRLQRFNQRAEGGYSSVPHSPMQRQMITPHSPHTDPIGVKKAYEMPGATVDELFPHMEELNLPGSSFDVGSSSNRPSSSTRPPPSSSARPAGASPYASPYQQPAPSPYGPATYVVHGSPYASPYQAPLASPYGPQFVPGTPTQSYINTAPSAVPVYPHTPPLPPLQYGYQGGPSPVVYGQSVEKVKQYPGPK